MGLAQLSQSMVRSEWERYRNYFNTSSCLFILCNLSYSEQFTVQQMTDLYWRFFSILFFLVSLIFAKTRFFSPLPFFNPPMSWLAT